MGRPKKSKADKRSHGVMVKLTGAELATLKKAAGQEPLSVYLRGLIFRATQRRGARKRPKS